jgi:hypothetical protein
VIGWLIGVWFGLVWFGLVWKMGWNGRGALLMYTFAKEDELEQQTCQGKTRMPLRQDHVRRHHVEKRKEKALGKVIGE